MLGGRGSWGTLAQPSTPSRPHVPVGRLCSLTRNTSCRSSTLFKESADLLLTYTHAQTYRYSPLDFVCPFFSHSLGRLFKCAEVAGTLSLVFLSSACCSAQRRPHLGYRCAGAVASAHTGVPR